MRISIPRDLERLHERLTTEWGSVFEPKEIVDPDEPTAASSRKTVVSALGKKWLEDFAVYERESAKLEVRSSCLHPELSRSKKDVAEAIAGRFLARLEAKDRRYQVKKKPKVTTTPA